MTLWENIPITTLDIISAMKDDGIKSLVTVGVPATFGLGVNRYKDKTFVKPDEKTIQGMFEIKDYHQKNYRQKKIFIGKEQIEITKEKESEVNDLRNQNAEKAIKTILPQLKTLSAELFKEVIDDVYRRYEHEAKDKVFGNMWHDTKTEEKTKEQIKKESAIAKSILGRIPKFSEQKAKDNERKQNVKLNK
jgi:hypothetical protein